MADYITAIDLGTSHLTGIVGEKNENGTFSIVACETAETDNCLQRGIIYNSDNTAKQVGDLIRRLESRLKGVYIDKLYVGVGGQSLRTINHIEAMDIPEGTTVTEEDIDFLKEKCMKYKPDLTDVLGMAPAVFYHDDQKDSNPVGVLCKRLEAHYKVVVGRQSIRNSIKNSIEAINGKELVGIIVSPLALADAVLSPNDRELGCALVDFGAGVTSVSVFKDGDLQHLCVIPLGGKLITRDITTLQLPETDAERLKKEKGSAIYFKEDENKAIKIEIDNSDREVKLSDLNAIIEGRAREIVENVHARISDVIDFRQLGSGIIYAGRAAELSNLPELLKERCSVKVRPAVIHGELVQGADEMLGNQLYMMAISLMMKGTKPCVSEQKTIGNNENTLMETGQEASFVEEEKPKPGKPPKPPKPPKTNGSGFKTQIKKIFTTDLFD